MIEVCEVTFKNGGKTYYFDPNGFKLKENVTIIVETDQGLQFGKVKNPNIKINQETLKSPLKPVIRISSKTDYQKHRKNLKDAKEVVAKTEELAQKYGLNMNVIEATYTFDRDKLLIKFLADNRIDFRQLVKDLAYIYHARIELRQIGARDKAKEVSGCGICGQKLCCSRFLEELDTVSINSAKNQNLSLNPSKINGVCGRLLCCLKYEDEEYKKCRKCLPKIGDKVKTEVGEGTVIGLDILAQEYKVEVPEQGIIRVAK